MALTIYRRHSKTCSQYGKPRNARYSRTCPNRCAIWVQGAVGPDYIRRSLKLSSWEAATALIRAWEDAGRIGGVAVRAPAADVALPPPATPTRLPQGEELSSARPAITTAIAKFTASLKRQKLSEETLRKYANLLDRRLVPWCTGHGYRQLDDLRVTQIDDFVETWTDGPLYATKNLERLRAFFRFCVARDWMAKNPAAEIKPPQVKTTPTLPFSEEEMSRILAACDRYRGDKDRIRAFVLAMRYSGLRISDTLALGPDRLTGNNLRLYTAKTGQPVFVPLPPVVVAALSPTTPAR